MVSSSVVFFVGALVSLATSWLLVSRLERIGRSLHLSEAMLGLLAALTADTPEITSAISAGVNHQHQIGTGVVLGSNAFNLAALLGLGALVVGRVTIHRRVVVLTGAVALWCAAVSLVTVLGALSTPIGLLLVLAVLLPYCWLAATHGRIPAAVPLSERRRRWFALAMREEELEVHESITARRAGSSDVVVAVGSLVVVVVASVAMERSASSLGARWAIPGILVGGIVLAAVTSLPNAVAGVYLARRGRGAATLSTAFNSNALNLLAGLLLPGAILGIGSVSDHVTLVAVWYVAMTALVIGFAISRRGFRRVAGGVVVASYLAFVVVLAATA